MKQQMLDTCTLDGLENIVEFLNNHNTLSHMMILMMLSCVR